VRALMSASALFNAGFAGCEALLAVFAIRTLHLTPGTLGLTVAAGGAAVPRWVILSFAALGALSLLPLLRVPRLSWSTHHESGSQYTKDNSQQVLGVQPMHERSNQAEAAEVAQMPAVRRQSACRGGHDGKFKKHRQLPMNP
jgi:hypothetical protein